MSAATRRNKSIARAIQGAERLIALDPTNSYWRQELATYQAMAAEALGMSSASPDWRPGQVVSEDHYAV